MEKIFYICLIFSSITFAQYIPTYVESSTGLNNPTWDGGRTEIEFADVNNDGNLDMLSIGDHGSPSTYTNQHGIMVWFGDGTGNWSVFQFGNFGYGGIAVGDVNNDGLLDVGYGMHHNYSGTDLGNQLIEVALGDGTGTIWTPWDDGLATNGESWGMFCTDFADIDNDGDLDIGANSFGSGSGVHVYLNQGDGSWVQSFGFLGGNSTMDFVFGDVNNDGFPDIAVAQQNGTVYLNDGTGNFSLADGNIPPGSSILRRGPDLGDIDNDGEDEISFANSNGGVEVWKWSEGNNWTLLSNGLPAGGGYDMTQLFDINIDGFIDVAAFGSGVITTWLGDGAGNWTQAAQFTLPLVGSSQAFRIDGDADHNGYPDIVLVDEEGSFPSYQNHLRFFKEDSPADQLSVNALHPGPNRVWNIYSVQNIRWISEVPVGDSSWVKLEISLNDTLGPWQLIASHLPNNGNFQWTIPELMASADLCRIRYTVYTELDSALGITPAGFYISPDLVPVGDIDNDHPYEFTLEQNYPNPFNPSTIIKFTISDLRFTILKIYDVLGNEIVTLVKEEKSAGNYEAEFAATSLSSGIYFYRLQAGSFVETKKMVLLR